MEPGKVSHKRVGSLDDKDFLLNVSIEALRARAIHRLPNFEALVEEVGEVAKDLQEGRDPRIELVQVATLAMRLATEEWNG